MKTAVTVTASFVNAVSSAVAVMVGFSVSMKSITHSAVTISLRSFLRVMKKTVPFASTTTGSV